MGEELVAHRACIVRPPEIQKSRPAVLQVSLLAFPCELPHLRLSNVKTQRVTAEAPLRGILSVLTRAGLSGEVITAMASVVRLA